MTFFKKYFWEIFFLSVLFIVGISFRLKGISTNHSFWADEALLSSFARDIVQHKLGLINGINMVNYSRLQTLTEVLFFGLFGPTEWAARIPSAIWGSVGIIFAYLLAKKYSNKWGGVLAAILYTFFQLNLVYSTQAKPYAAIETLFLVAVYYADTHPWISLLTGIASGLYNYLGFISIFPLVIIWLPKLLDRLSKNKKIIISAAIIVMLIVGLLSGKLSYFYRIQYNWITYTRELFWRQFGFITLPAIFGLFLIKDKKVLFGILAGILALLFYWNFIFYSHNIRYLMPIFGILIVAFGIFWTKVGELVFRRSWLVCFLVIFMIFIGGYKIVRKPSVYYTPNADFFADVQNADYKTFFHNIYSKYPQFDSYPVFANLYDPFAWYGGKKPDALFMKGNTNLPVQYNNYKVMVYPSLDYFLLEMKKYPRGFVVMEDWQSFMPDDIKEYVKKNLKFELRVESMEVSPDDKWPLELYSWGFDSKN